MARLKTEKITYRNDNKDSISCKTEIHVDVDGFFTTTLPPETVKLLEDSKVDLGTNRMGRKGYLSNKNLDALIENVKQLFKEALSRTLLSETIVIQYSIETFCAYLVDPETKDIIPNGYWLKSRSDGGCYWTNGTKGPKAMETNNYGLQVYAKPFTKKVYIYGSGKTKTEYEQIYPQTPDYDYKDRPNLAWLSCVVKNEPSGAIKEIEYNEAIAKFFVDCIKSIMMINEQIKDRLDPDTIKLIAENGLKLIG